MEKKGAHRKQSISIRKAYNKFPKVRLLLKCQRHTSKEEAHVCAIKESADENQTNLH